MPTEKKQAPALLFDFGGVLVDLDKERCIHAFDAMGFDIRPFLGTYRQAGVFSLLERGEISVAEFCNELRRLAKNPELTDESIVEAWRKYLLDVPTERLELLLKAHHHYELYILSNTNFIHWDMAREGYFRYKGLEVEDFFDGVFLSCELGVEKPAPEIFQKVVEGIGRPAGEILFFDDSEVNCEAARQCGLQARLAPAGSRWLSYFDETGRLYEA
ncbi:MAG: HAD family phosphatase [Bacteroidaceae bacterium]|nr:HAD family phosphatase [Bacteroidaceae bacterium]